MEFMAYIGVRFGLTVSGSRVGAKGLGFGGY